MKLKKGQAEIVGFVLIIVIVAVVFLVFLGISLRKSVADVTESRDVYQFLESSMEYTTSCVTSFYPDYRKLGELFDECWSRSDCLDGKNSCEVLNGTLKNITETSWLIGENSPFKGYEFISVYKASAQSVEEEIISLNSGDCNGNILGASYLVPTFPGHIENRLKICN